MTSPVAPPLEALILGLIQGFSEFLPISSSGHLILVPWLMGWHYYGKAFDVALHAGTFVAILLYFWRDLFSIGMAFLHRKGVKEQERRQTLSLGWCLIISTIPGAAAGVALNHVIEEHLSTPLIASLALLLFAFLLWAAEHLSAKRREMKSLTYLEALLIGGAQALALIPGVSRSGITMTALLFLGLSRGAAARYSFLISLPIIGGAAIYEGVRLLHGGFPLEMTTLFLMGVLSAFLSGYLCIAYFLRYLQRGTLLPFVIYRILAGAAFLSLLLLGR